MKTQTNEIHSVTLRMPAGLYGRIKSMANRDRRSVTQQIIKLLIENPEVKNFK